MLEHASAMPVITVPDLEQAASFYTKRLGLTRDPAGESPGHRLLECPDGSHIALHEVEDFEPGEHTVAGFIVDDLEDTMDQLRHQGIVFEEYDLPDLKTEDGIYEGEGVRSAWFRDRAGNVLCLDELASSSLDA